MNMRDATTGQGVVWCIFFLKLALFPIFIQMRNLFCCCLACSYVGEWRVGLWPRWNGGEIVALNSEVFILSSVPAVPWISCVSCCHIAGTDSERNFEMQTGCIPSRWTMRKLWHWHTKTRNHSMTWLILSRSVSAKSCLASDSATLLDCALKSQVSRELNFSSLELMTSLRLVQSVWVLDHAFTVFGMHIFALASNTVRAWPGDFQRGTLGGNLLWKRVDLQRGFGVTFPKEWNFHFGFVIPNSTNTWQQTIEAFQLFQLFSMFSVLNPGFSLSGCVACLLRRLKRKRCCRPNCCSLFRYLKIQCLAALISY